MIKNNNNDALSSKGIDKRLYFFIQLWHELLSKKTMDIYQYRILNTFSSLTELVDVIDKTNEGVFYTFHNIGACVGECYEIVSKDVILKKHNNSLWKILQKHLNTKKEYKDKSDLCLLRSQIHYALSSLKEYTSWIFEDLKEQIQLEVQDYSKIYYLTNSLVSQFIFGGWSPRGLYDCDFVFYNDQNNDFESQWDHFQNNLLHRKIVFYTYINIKEIRPEISSVLVNIGLTCKTGEEIINSDNLSNIVSTKISRGKRYICIQEVAKDLYSAAYQAIKKLSDKINILSFYNNLDAWDVKNISLIVVNEEKNYSKELSSEDLFKTYDYIDTSGHIFSNTLELIRKDEYKQIAERLYGSFSYTNISRSSMFQEEKYMTLWIALESLAKTDMYSDIISNIKNAVPPALSQRYLYRIIRNFIEDLIRCDVDLRFSNVEYNINDESKSTLVKTVMKILRNNQLYEELKVKCQISDLLKYRLKEVHDIVCNLEIAKKKVINYHTHVTWQLQRLYRIRNEIAHFAKSDQASLTIYTEHLYDYLSTFVTEIVSCAVKNSKTTLSETLCKIQDNYTVLKEIKTDDNADYLSDTILSYGIIDFL